MALMLELALPPFAYDCMIGVCRYYLLGTVVGMFGMIFANDIARTLGLAGGVVGTAGARAITGAGMGVARAAKVRRLWPFGGIS